GALGGDDEQALLHALPPLTFGCLWSMRVLPSLAAPPPPVGEPTGRSERPARMAKQQRRPEWRQGRPPGRPEGTRGAEQSEHRSALDASGGRSYLGAPE